LTCGDRRVGASTTRAAMSPGLRLWSWVNRNVFMQNRSVAWAVHPTSQVIKGAGYIVIMDDCHNKKNNNALKSFAQSGGCYYQGKNSLLFDASAIWGPGCKFISASRRESDDGYKRADAIILAPNVRIGANVCILPGVVIGPGSIVGAGSVVTHSFPNGGEVMAGNPAKVIRRRVFA
jgi:acetyltransferase-like isoleucine patch superfamily enzyme